MSMTNARPNITTATPSADLTRRKPQLSLRFLIFLVTMAAGVLSLILTPSSINIHLGAVCCLTAGAVYGASVLRNVRGIGPLRGRAFGGAWGGAVAGLFVLLVLRIAGPWQPILYRFEYLMYWWFSCGAIFGAAVGCLTATFVSIRFVPPRQSSDAVIKLADPTGCAVIPVPDSTSSGLRRWLRGRVGETPAWYAAAFIHISLITSIGALTLASHRLPIDGYRSEPLAIIAANQFDPDDDNTEESATEITMRDSVQSLAPNASRMKPGGAAVPKVAAASPELALQSASQVLAMYLEAVKRGDAHPCFAVTDKNGEFEIRNLPQGQWTFQTWHERIGYISSVKRKGNTENWPRGRPVVAIEADAVDLGEILVPTAAFE